MMSSYTSPPKSQAWQLMTPSSRFSDADALLSSWTGQMIDCHPSRNEYRIA